MKKYLSSLYIICAFLLVVIATANGSQDYESFLKQGKEAFNAGNYNSAELLFRKATESDDDETRDRAWFYLARSIYEQKNFKSSLYEFNSFLNKCKTSEVCFESRFWIGETYFRQNKFNKAIVEYKRFISNSKDLELIAVARDRIALIYYGQKRFDESAIEWEKSIASSGDKQKNAWRVYRISEAYFKNNKYQESLKRIKPLLTSKADEEVIAKARILSGHIYLIQNNPRRALILLNGIPSHLLKKTPFNEAQYFKALCHLKFKNFRTARSLLELFILIGKDSPWYYNAQYELGLIHYNQKKYKQCTRILKTVIYNTKNQDVKAKAASVVGSIYFDENPAESVHYLELALPIATDNEKKDILFMLGKAQLRIKNHEKAELVFNRFLAEYPFYKKIDEVKFNIARVYLEQGNVDKAVKMFRKIQEENPFSGYIRESKFYLAVLHYKKRENKKAQELLLRYLKAGKIENRYEGYLLLLKIYLDNRDSVNSIRYARLLVSRYGNNKKNIPVIYSLVKTIPNNKRDKNYFISYLLNNFPSSQESLSIFLTSGDRYFKNKLYKKAQENYKKYLTHNGVKQAGKAFYRMILSLYQMGSYSEVIKTMENGKFPPMNETQWENIPYILARSNFELKKYDQAYNLLYNKDIKRFPPDILSIWIKSSFNVGDALSARNAIKLITADKNRYSEALYYAGEYHINRAEQDEAIDFFSRILTETPGTKYVGFANLSYAKIYFSRNRYKDAVEKLKNIKLTELKPESTAYIIMCYFNLNEEKKQQI